jgi:hypothetical protein
MGSHLKQPYVLQVSSKRQPQRLLFFAGEFFFNKMLFLGENFERSSSKL